ncbi:hypothetical protein BD779DRAFT_440967 [Infundibulicybe gibba]|nr:hypothetical protein BD779DRAFT_440967 [Infundibulicybe gibba]
MAWPKLQLMSLGLISSAIFMLYMASFRLSADLLITRSPSDSTTLSSVSAPPRILLVSAFFPIPKSKHTLPQYLTWIQYFISTIHTDIYFFTPLEFEQRILAARPDHLPIIVNTTFDSPFSIPPLNRRDTKRKYTEMHTQDREKARHSPELYAIWNAKPYFLAEVAKNAPIKYDYIFWVDAGSFRMEHAFRDWPGGARVDEVWEQGSRLTGTAKKDLMFFPLSNLFKTTHMDWEVEMGPIDEDISEGSFFGGSPETNAWWMEVYYDHHDYYLERGIFVGKDQTLINALLLLFPSRIIAVWPNNPTTVPHLSYFPFLPIRPCWSEWYYYQYWLASPQERRDTERFAGSSTIFGHLDPQGPYLVGNGAPLNRV